MNERQILQILMTVKQQKEQLESQERGAWDSFFAIADEKTGATNLPYRYIDAETEMVIARIIAHSQSLNMEALQEDPEFTEAMRRFCTRKVTTVTFDPALLEAAVRLGKVPATLVAKYTSDIEQVRRYGPREASREDKAALSDRGQIVR